MDDMYGSFTTLAAAETQGVHYRIVLADRGTSVVVLAPHGGSIEPGSSQIAEAIALEDYSLYCFEGLCPGRPHGDLHITSSRFDEPTALKLVTAAKTVIAVHGRVDRSDPKTVWMGGRDDVLRDAIASSLNASGFPAIINGHPLLGRDGANICNRGTSRAGVQLEIPRTLRDLLRCDRAKLDLFAGAVRESLAHG
jgi:phage replication-related protein YjqB (UPF0714/DUF867 family)